MTQFEHLELPKTEIEYTKRSRRHPKSNKGGNRSEHGSKLLNQLDSLINRPEKQYLPFGINPKLIFKVKLRKDFNFSDDDVINSGLNLVARETKSKQAIIVFSSDDKFKKFKEKLKVYSGEIDSKYEYGYLDNIEDLVPLEPEDKIGRLLQLEPLKKGELVPLDLELWHTGNKQEMKDYIKIIDDFLRSLTQYPDMKVSDQYIGDYVCVARIKLRQEVLERLLAEDMVKEIDRRPQPAFESPQEINVPLSEFEDVISPPLNNTGVLVIDSGVQRGHPFIKEALGDTEVFRDPEGNFIKGTADDAHTEGHGTGVSGIAIYGDISQNIKDKKFQPQVWLFSARVTNENSEYDPDLLLDNQLEKAVDYFVRNYSNCKVINISLGDSNLIYQDGEKQFRLAAKIDELAYSWRDYNILFVISAGNFEYQPESNELLKTEYPNYLLDEKAKIIEPATAAIALTVGSLSMGKGSMMYHEDACRNAIAKIKGYPSPFTRIGFGVDGMIKPELVDFGGDLVLDKTRMIYNEQGVSVITLNKNFQGNSLFKAFCCTSFSAPRVANLAAQLFTKFPNATSNLIRALIADSAELPSEIPPILQGKETEQKQNRLKIYGYGQPNFDRSAYSTENQVVLLEDNEVIPVGKFRIYEIPTLPDEFLNTKGERKISITLAFDPPTRHTRGDSYLGITMEFRVFRNIDKESLQNAFIKATQEKNTEKLIEISMEDLKNKNSSNIELDLFPKNHIRKKGTLQKGSVNISKSNWRYNKEPLYIVVSCNRKWAKEYEVSTQRFALVASVTHSNPQVDLYNQIKLRTRISQKVRIR